MGSMSIVHWAIVIGVVVLLFGRGKVSGLMGDFAQGVKSFKRGLQEDEPRELEKTEASRDVLPVERNAMASTDQKHLERT